MKKKNIHVSGSSVLWIVAERCWARRAGPMRAALLPVCALASGRNFAVAAELQPPPRLFLAPAAAPTSRSHAPSPAVATNAAVPLRAEGLRISRDRPEV
jgi:hypothetical protein